MNCVFLMDPLSRIHPDKDTTYMLMLGACERGHQVYYLPEGGISLKNGALFFQTHRVIPQRDLNLPFLDHGPCALREADVDILFIRTDPPFDADYLLHTWLLDHFAEHAVVINHPAGLRAANEKLWATRFPQLMPPTLISRRQEELLDFVAQEKDVIAKPTDGHGGKSVFHIQKNDKNTKVILETLTQGYTTSIVLQKYVPQAQEGDKRILLLNGQPLGAILRVHEGRDHRNNFFSGGTPQPTTITARDEEIISALSAPLQKLGLYFVGIDVIGDYLTEVNVTSPTCLQEMNRAYQVSLEREVIRFAEQLIAQKKGIA